jgi:DNA-directed RNA polymerase specialized sigma24 family protein
VSELVVEGLYKEHGPELAAALLLSTWDSYEAESLTHETFLRAATAERAPRDSSDPRIPLYRTAYGLARRRRSRFGLGPRLTVAEEHPILSPRGIASSHALFAALHGLGPLERDVTVLHELVGFRIPEVARVLGRDERTLEAALGPGRAALATTPDAGELFGQLAATANPVHEERLEDLSYAQVGERSPLAYVVGALAVLMLLWWVGARVLGGSNPPPNSSRAGSSAPPPPPTAAPASGAPGGVTATPAEPPESASPEPVATAIATTCRRSPARSGRSTGPVIHLRARDVVETAGGNLLTRRDLELWLDPANGDARLVEKDIHAPGETLHVRSGDLYTVGVHPNGRVATRELLDASDPYLGPPQEEVYGYKRMLEGGKTPAWGEESVDGRRAVIFYRGERQYAQTIKKLWVDKQDGKLLREFDYWVRRDRQLELQVRRNIRYTLVERLGRSKVPSWLFERPGSRAQPPPGARGDTRVVKGTDMSSPLAIPARTLERMGLRCFGAWGPSDSLSTLLARHRGKRVFSNIWSGEDGDRGSFVTGVLDERYAFPSPTAARGFLSGGVLNDFGNDRGTVGVLTRTIRLGGKDLLYRDLSIPYRGSYGQRVYVFAFQVDRFVARVGVAGSERMSERQALSLVQAALRQVQRATTPSDRSSQR